MNLNPLYVIGGFVGMVLAPVAAAALIGVRTKKKRESGSHKAVHVSDPTPPGATLHLRPKPRRRGMR